MIISLGLGLPVCSCALSQQDVAIMKQMKQAEATWLHYIRSSLVGRFASFRQRFDPTKCMCSTCLFVCVCVEKSCFVWSCPSNQIIVRGNQWMLIPLGNSDDSRFHSSTQWPSHLHSLKLTQPLNIAVSNRNLLFRGMYFQETKMLVSGFRYLSKPPTWKNLLGFILEMISKKSCRNMSWWFPGHLRQTKAFP